MNSSKALTSQSLLPPSLMESGLIPVLSVGLGFLILRYLHTSTKNTPEASLSGKDIQPISDLTPPELKASIKKVESPKHENNSDSTITSPLLLKSPLLNSENLSMGFPKDLMPAEVVNKENHSQIPEAIDLSKQTNQQKILEYPDIPDLIHEYLTKIRDLEKFQENLCLLLTAQKNGLLSKKVNVENLGQEELKKIADKIRQDDLTFLRNLQQANHIDQSLNLDALSCKDLQERALEFHNESTIKVFSTILKVFPPNIGSCWKGNPKNALQIRDFLYQNKERLSNIKSLSFNGFSLKSIPLELKYFTSLRSLDLSNNRISDITPVINLPNLKELSLHGNPISDITLVEHLIDSVELDIFLLLGTLK